MFTYTVAQYTLAWLAYRLALDFFTLSPYLQRKTYSMKGHQFLLNMLYFKLSKFS
nr:MAG TPA_asm: orotidine 5'-phosphate decarboxylase [Caudoviricetes sp.]